MKLLTILLIYLISIAYVLAGTVYKVKVKSTLNIRKSASTSSSIVGSLKNGQFIYATSVSKGWAKFYKGYVSTSYLVKVTSGSTYLTTDKLNFRTGPSTKYGIITTKNKGTAITYFGKDPFTTSWGVTNNGYANTKYLKAKSQAKPQTKPTTTSSLKITKILSNKKNYGNQRSTSNIKYIVIHYTANNGDSAKSNGNYFKNNVVKASAHYFVDDNTIVQSVPDNYVAYSVGGSKYNNKGGRLYKKATNSNTLNIELCDTKKDKTVMATSQTINLALSLVRSKMKQYKISKNNVIRHYDVTGKSCPAYWVNDSRWKKKFWKKI